MNEITITLDTVSLVDFLGAENKNVKKIASYFPESKIISRGNEVKIIGTQSEISKIEDIIKMLLARYNKFGVLNPNDIESVLGEQNSERIPKPESNTEEEAGKENPVIVYGTKGYPVKAKTPSQHKLVHEIANQDIVFAVGTAGTGKTYMAVALAVASLKNKEVKKIIITRPAVEAGENLGFLPGDLEEKIEPYLRPVYDALDDMLDYEKFRHYLETSTIEIAPLAYMRGRTLSNAFIILDEAQNATEMQLKMFLTRIGKNSKVIITGDPTQVDLPPKQKSGLIQAVDILKNIDGISIIHFTGEDVQRHKLVKAIVKAYEKTDD